MGETSEPAVLTYFKEQHAALNRNFDVLYSSVRMIYEHQQEPAGPQEADWPSTADTLYRVLHYFTHDFSKHQEFEETLVFSRLMPKLLPEEKIVVAEIVAEHEALQRLIEHVTATASLWLKGLKESRPPSRPEIEGTYRAVMELRAYLGMHEKTEDEKVLPLAASLLEDYDFEDMRAELRQAS